ncbi:Sin3 associated polypeptide p18-domain-containing protein [Absidia repens]|uniref:Sin3 associated polypeptide p18-domain-containing protein n=1 Tax=Absidia repens TaxID=90262 RepID=A0A1X2IHA3_9FUNG|nr:Sin3 associated polypeptide p18-domain-containing protein [Absidia repens]
MSQSPPLAKIDREKVCPFLLKIYTQVGRHHSVNEYQNNTHPPIQDELPIYTWKDATLGEIALLVQEVVPEARHADAHLTFRLIYLDTVSGRHQQTEIGQVINAEESKSQSKTLEDCRFMIGDYLDVAVHMGDPRSSYGDGGHGTDRYQGRRNGGGFSFRHRGRGGRRF